MGNIDTNGDGRIDMRIEDTAHGLGQLRANADGLKGALDSAFADIDTLTGLLGKGGKMSDQFMAKYNEWRNGTGPVCVVNPTSGDPNTSVRNEPGLEQGVRDVPVNYHKLADSGDGAVAKYREAEQNAVNQFRR